MEVKILKIKPRGDYTVLYVEVVPYFPMVENWNTNYNLRYTNSFVADRKVGDVFDFNTNHPDYMPLPEDAS